MKYILLLSFILGSVVMADEIDRKERIVRAFQDYDGRDHSLLDSFYHPDVHFLDPVGEMRGLDQLKSYYEEMYKNVIAIDFNFHHIVEERDHLIGTWTMTYQVNALNGGRPIEVLGNSHITFDPETNLVIYHRDYFDLGEMVYEHVPFIGALVRYIKNKLGH